MCVLFSLNYHSRFWWKTVKIYSTCVLTIKLPSKKQFQLFPLFLFTLCWSLFNIARKFIFSSKFRGESSKNLHYAYCNTGSTSCSCKYGCGESKYTVQGRYDVVCPMKSAWDLHQALPHSKLEVSQQCHFLDSSDIQCKNLILFASICYKEDDLRTWVFFRA